uniref:Uncharacterized protein n=1 Tax=Timema cristinae TaxID=61476 RepID=A0A7R9H0T3_TIMCR|nr:unnamed protein product [Timema cristinae]
MKQMHNIRILSADVLDLCRARLQQQAGNIDPDPQRLQTALGLYSSDLCGLVLLADSHVGHFSGLTKEVSEVCQQSTEFHFPSMDEQLEKVRVEVKKAVSWRQAHCGRHENLVSLTSSEQLCRRGGGGTKNMQTGDVYITRHSNLAEVHVVFHMVIDDTLKSNDINSRHPAILGLRNILKTACSNDITTLTVPVLLMHEMSEEMTVAWCTKRAELVFKCVKGFMIEMASWGGSELKNLQFLVPKVHLGSQFGDILHQLKSGDTNQEMGNAANLSNNNGNSNEEEVKRKLKNKKKRVPTRSSSESGSEIEDLSLQDSSSGPENFDDLLPEKEEERNQNKYEWPPVQKEGISEDVFGTLAMMLPSIFRVSNPLVFKVSSTPHTPKNGK